MTDELDRFLSGEEGIAPSSGFTASVMEAVRAEAATPPPIPFPWGRALPGLVAAGLVAAAVLVSALTRLGQDPSASPAAVDSGLGLASLAASAASNPEATWVLVAALTMLAALRLGLRLAQGH
jgi:hypothetical protein